MLLTSVRLTLALFVLAPVVAAIVFFVGRRYRRISHRIQRSMGSVAGIVDEVVSGQREVKIYGGQNYEEHALRRVADENRRLNLKVSSTNALSTSLVQLVAACSLAAVIFVATRPGMHPQHGSGLVHVGDHVDDGHADVAETAHDRAGRHAARHRRGAGSVRHRSTCRANATTARSASSAAAARSTLRGVELEYPGQMRRALNGIDLVLSPPAP